METIPAELGKLPGPKRHLIVGHLPEVHHDLLGFFTWCARKYGDFVPLRYGPWLSSVLVSHPEAIEEVLVTHARSFHKSAFYRSLARLVGNGLLISEGEFWHRQRRLSQPAFHHQRIAGYARTMVVYTERMLADWEEGQVRDMQKDMSRLTMAIVVKALFDADVTQEAAEVGAALSLALHEINELVTGPALLLPEKVPTPGKARLRRAVHRLDEVVYRIIRERRASGEERGDLLSALLHATDVESGHSMTDTQLRDEMMTLFLAGHETTALALAWTWYLLSLHPEVHARLLSELRAVLGGRPPDVSDVARLPYTGAVLSESMRLYPPIPSFGRQAIQDCEIGGHPLRAGTNVTFSPWVVQRDPRFYEEPERFLPERWEAGLAAQLPKFAYFPFGGGPRLCIGRSFALLEATLVLAIVAQRFKLRVLPTPPVVPIASVTLRPKNGIPVVLERV